MSVKSTVKPQTITVRKKKKTEKTELIRETKKQDSVASETKKERSEIITKDREVKKTGFLVPWYWYLILLLIAAGYVLYRVYIKRK